MGIFLQLVTRFQVYAVRASQHGWTEISYLRGFSKLGGPTNSESNP